MSMFTLLSFAAHLDAIEADLKLAGQCIIAEWCWAVREMLVTRSVPIGGLDRRT
jgi:hypothetical protein